MRGDLSTRLKCPACDLTNTVHFFAPKPLTASVVKYKCEYCESIIVARILCKKRTDILPTVISEQKIHTKGQSLIMMEKEIEGQNG